MKATSLLSVPRSEKTVCFEAMLTEYENVIKIKDDLAKEKDALKKEHEEMLFKYMGLQKEHVAL